MSNDSIFSSFGKTSANTLVKQSPKLAVAYTRVSGKEQADKNPPLETRKKSIEEYATRNGIAIETYFGGTHESAKTDGRKEFQRMLKHVEKGKGNLGYILVYTLDRFSLTGGGAIKLARELREKFGVSVLAVTQPADTGNPSGILHQDIQFIFSHYDNQLRKQKAVAGMREKLNRGERVVRVPIGFDIVRTNGRKKILINSESELIK